MTLKWTKTHTIPVYTKMDFLGVEVDGPSTKAIFTINRSSKLILPPPIWWIIQPLFIWMNHVWIVPTLRWYKITTIKPKVNFMIGMVGGNRNRTHTNFTITTWRSTSRIRLIIPTQWWDHGGHYAMNLVWLKPPIIPVSA